MTGSGTIVSVMDWHMSLETFLTSIVSCNGSLHDGLHPIPDDDLFIGAEEVHPVVLMLDAGTHTCQDSHSHQQ